MTAFKTKLRVSPDGKIVVPVDVADAGTEVNVTIEPVRALETINGIPKEEWFAILNRTAGSIDDDTFQRPPQRPHEATVNFDD